MLASKPATHTRPSSLIPHVPHFSSFLPTSLSFTVYSISSPILPKFLIFILHFDFHSFPSFPCPFSASRSQDQAQDDPQDAGHKPLSMTVAASGYDAGV
jgi:hypothetical protein